ncbi:RIP metalloprotease RseP [Ruminococcaceae bacterium OttesenSCG-928-O06]|nr:RIP metalloprotease RseP [Ruminococcaceae bacterium OttesenSCG-928-O06]
MLTLLIAVLVFGAVIFFHELGHFAVAKWSGIKVNEFAIGMGPVLFKFGKGETQYALRLFPIGGFVSMEGEDEDSSDERAFQKAPVWRRILVIIAGAFMNFVLGFLALVLLTGVGDTPIASREVARVENEATGLQEGDIITRINGRRAFIFYDLDYEFARTQNGVFDLEVKRDGKKVLLENIAFETKIAYNEETGEAIIDEATGEPYEYLDIGFKVWAVKKTFTSVIKEAFFNTLSYARIIYLTLFDLVAGRLPINQLSGPVGIVSEISKATNLGWRYVVNLLALISVNLGVVNMLPLPALDGGKTLLLVLEGIRRKPIPKKYEAAINIVGLVLLLCLMVFVSFNDIRKLIV